MQGQSDIVTVLVRAEYAQHPDVARRLIGPCIGGDLVHHPVSLDRQLADARVVDDGPEGWVPPQVPDGVLNVTQTLGSPLPRAGLPKPAACRFEVARGCA